MKNKNGQAGVTALVLLAVIVIVISVFAFTGGFQKIIGEKDVKGADCTITPSIVNLTSNTLVAGTSPALSTAYTIYDGDYIGNLPSSPSAGSSLDVVGLATNYLNSEAKISSIKCGVNNLKFDFTPYQIPTYTIYQKNSIVVDGIAGAGTGATNVTSSANQITLQVEISGVPDKSTGAMLIVVEYNNKTEVASSGISLAGATRVDTPSWYSVSATTSSVASFTVPAVVDGGSKSYDLTFTPESGQTMGAVGAGLYTTLYTMNPVILDSQTGTFLTGNTFSDSLGADQTIANIDYDAYFI